MNEDAKKVYDQLYTDMELQVQFWQVLVTAAAGAGISAPLTDEDYTDLFQHMSQESEWGSFRVYTR